MSQNAIKKRIGLGLRRYLEADQLSRKYKPYFGCEADFLRAFIGHQFNGQMHWDNFGSVWKIGHVVPLSAFDQTREKDLTLCWNWINLRPVRDTASRCYYSGIEARRVLEWRRKFFRSNKAMDGLLERATQMASEEVQAMTDWSLFDVEQ